MATAIEEHALGVENDPSNQRDWNFRVAVFINLMLEAGFLSPAREFTLTAAAASTVVTDERAHTTSLVLWMALTENAALEDGGMLDIDTAPMYVSAQADGSFTLAHANHAAADRTFRYVLLG